MYRVFNLFKVLKLYCEVEVFEDCNWVIGNFLLLLNCFALNTLNQLKFVIGKFLLSNVPTLLNGKIIKIENESVASFIIEEFWHS